MTTTDATTDTPTATLTGTSCDVRDWGASPAEVNPDGFPDGPWIITAGDYADEGEPDLYIEIHGEHPRDIARFIIQAVRNEYARLNDRK